MKKLTCVALCAGCLVVAAGAFAQDQGLGRMDANQDGKISRDEFMSYHEKLWENLEKDENGMVDSKALSQRGMMHGSGPDHGSGRMRHGEPPDTQQGPSRDDRFTHDPTD
jgi:hypothetical protein